MTVSKYCASGNDFVIFHAFVKRDRSELARKLCDRQNGVGADGMIVLLPHPELDFEWQFYNADGSTAEMCGNGSRACAHYAWSHGLAATQITFLTQAGEIRARVEGSDVTSDLTPPQILQRDIEHGGKRWWLVNTGVPHLVTFDGDFEHFDLQEARELRRRYNANVNIAHPQPGGALRVRTYERGVEDETRACGTGMAACFVRAHVEGLVADRIHVFPRSGETLRLAYVNGTVTFGGHVVHTFDAQLALQGL